MGNKPETTEVMQEETDPLVKEDIVQKESSSLQELKREDDSSMEHKSINLDIVIDFYSDDFCAEDVEIQMLQARLDQTEQTLQKLIGKLGAERALYLTSNTDD